MRQGFSILELAILLVIAGSLAAASTMMGSAYLAGAEVRSTRENIRTIDRAINSYVRVNKRLPCPADESVSHTDADFGKEATGLGTCTAATTTSGEVKKGVLPFQTLGMSKSMAYDAWGNRLNYYVDRRMTVENAIDIYPDQNTTIGDITVQDLAGSVRTDKAVYAVMSTGAKAHGSFNRSGNMRTLSDPSADELENTDVNAAGASTGADKVLVQGMIGKGSDAKDFDDILSYKKRSNLVSSNVNTIQNCLFSVVNWSQGAANCTGSVSEIADGTVVTVSDTTPADMGSVTVSCNAGVLTQSSPVCTTAPADCSPGAVNWTVDAACAGTVGSTVLHGATTGTITNTTGGRTGSAVFTCNNGSFSVNAGAVCGNNCTAGTANWTGTASCTAAYGALNHQANSTISDATAPGLGNVTMTCTNGTASQSAATCTPAGCGATTLTWGAGCSAGVTAQTDGYSGGMTNSAAGYTGTGTAVCTDGAWSVTSPVCNADCAAQAVNWTVSGQNCTSSVGALTHGALMSVTDTVATSTGAVTVTCNNGTLNQSAATCTTTAACMVGSAESLRFNGVNEELYKTIGTAPTSQRTQTVSFWMKPSNLSSSLGSGMYYLGNAAGNGSVMSLVYMTDGSMRLAYDGSGAGIRTRELYRDFSSWMHVVAVLDTTQAVSSERIRLYVNGVRVTNFVSATYPALNLSINNTAGNIECISPSQTGGCALTSPFQFHGYLDKYHRVDGQALEPTAFGEFDSNNIWIPKTYSGAYGTNGFKLEFDNATSVATLGNDSSGNNRHFTAHNFSIAADATKDSVGDHPGMNYATWNPLINFSGIGYPKTFSNGNLGITDTACTSCPVRATIFTKTGKWYYEAVVGTSNYFGICADTMAEFTSSGAGYSADSWSIYTGSGQKYTNSSSSAYGSSLSSGDIVQTAWDMDSGKVWWGKNGTWFNSGDPAAGTNPAFTNLAGHNVTPCTPHTSTANFGQQPWRFTPPSGFQALSASNLPTPSIMKPSEHFDVITYRGNGGGQQIGQIARDASSYQLERSVRFRASNGNYLTRTFTAGNRRTSTLSWWVKRGSLGGPPCMFFTRFYPYTTPDLHTYITFDASDRLQVAMQNSGTYDGRLLTNRSFKDTSRWYHMTLVMDSTNATVTDRMQLYVDGVRETSFAAQTNLPLNRDSEWNEANRLMRIGTCHDSFGNVPSFPFDGYMTDVHFIDGQALDASAFGEFDSKGHWQPKAYSGTYGTNGFRLEFKDNSPMADLGKDTSGNGNHWTPTGFSVANDYTNDSLIDVPTSWDDAGTGAYATWNPATSDGVTFSGGNLIADTAMFSNQARAGVGISSGKYYWEVTPTAGTPAVSGFGGGYACIGLVDGSSAINVWLGANTKGWAYCAPQGLLFHNNANGAAVGAAYNVGDVIGVAFDADAGKLFFAKNGVWQNSSNPVTGVNAAVTGLATGATYFPALGDASNGAAVTYSTNFGASAFAHSPPAGFSALRDGGRGHGNYPTLNPLDQRFGATITNGNLDFSIYRDTSAFANIDIPKTGKWYWETDFRANGVDSQCGIAADRSPSISGFASGGYHARSDGNNYVSSTFGGWQGPIAAGTVAANGVCMVAVDRDNGKFYTGFNGVWFGGGNPVTGVNAINRQPGTAGWSIDGIRIVPAAGNHSPIWDPNYSEGSFNFGQRPFAYGPPTGYKALNSQNAGTTTKFVNQPDLVWLKSRTSALAHALYDSARGIFKDLASNSTAAETTEGGGVVQFNDDGVLIGDLAKINSVTPYSHQNVGWMWNEDPTAGFDIVNYTGNGGAQTVPHNLGKKPAFMIVFNRSSASRFGWIVWHQSMPATDWLVLSDDRAQSTYNFWQNTAPDANNFYVQKVSSNGDTNNAGEQHVAYLWSEIPGFSKFGSYIGNGSTDGPFVYTGFKPRWVIFKRTDSAAHWHIYDTERRTINPNFDDLSPNTSEIENSTVTNISDSIDILSNGFKYRNAEATGNDPGGKYIFAAFAEKPFTGLGSSDSGSASCGCALPWGGSIASGASVTAYQNAAPACGGSCTSETRTCTNGVLSGSYTAQSCTVAACTNCGAGTANWTVGGKSCTASVGAIAHGGSTSVTDSTGPHEGSATVSCTNGVHGYSGTACDDADYGFCGLSINNQGSHSSHFYNGSGVAVSVPCQGVNPGTTCPVGYSQLQFNAVTWAIDSISDSVTTCVKNGASSFGELAGSFCGAAISNTGTRYSHLMNGSWSGNVNCGISNPIGGGCPSGFNNFSLGTISWQDDSTADYLNGCIRNSGSSMATAPAGSWCGMTLVNSGSHSSLYWNSGSNVACEGHTPSTSCPAGYQQLAIGARAWAIDSIADYAYTCVKTSAAAGGLLCGHSTYNIYNGWSDGMACQGTYPRNGCPSGYTVQSVISNGGVDYHYHCVDAGSGSNGAGMLCGASTYNNYNGWSDGIVCGSDYPRNACPSGYSQSSVIYGGGVDTECHCASTGAASGGGRLCGHSTYNIYNGWSDGIACYGTYPRGGCPSGFTQRTVISNGGIDIHYYCSSDL